MSRVFGEDAALVAGGGVTVRELIDLEDAIGRSSALPSPEAGVVDMHCHLGRDADGHRLAAEDLVADLDRHGLACAVCFPANDPGPDGSFGDANARVIEAARLHAGRIIPFCRVDPGRHPLRSIERAAAGGAVGLKLHPVAQRFALDDPAVIEAVGAAAGRGWPTLIHTGFAARPVARALGRLIEAAPAARLILAHGGRGDARGIIEAIEGRDGVYLDTSLAALPDLLALGPRRLCFGSDRPYGDVATGLQLVARAAAVGGWTDEQLCGVLGDNARAALA